MELRHTFMHECNKAYLQSSIQPNGVCFCESGKAVVWDGGDINCYGFIQVFETFWRKMFRARCISSPTAELAAA